MRPLQNILDLYQFTALVSEGIDPHSSGLCYLDCITQVTQLICDDGTTTNDNLREKALNYALNYIANHPELSINKESVAQKVADEVEKKLQDRCFNKRPPADIIAQEEREKISEEPENKFIKFA